MESGSKLGTYEVTRELGRGGMGVVYLGRDTRLDRDVAIKALPVHLAQDPDRLVRFEREAKTLAQLNHPNVAGIHGIEEHGGARFLVLEYVEGETLAQRLDRGALPVDEALEIAVQIAAGVEAAHEAGVIHRDLKPGNVIVTPDGKAKVLDFGLARAEESSSSTSFSTTDPTITSPAKHSPTMPGVILGTAAYMSPEQARGRRIDKRTDIWSFGVVLYEMLTGVNPFGGATVSDSIGAVLHKEVEPDSLPKATPARIRRVLTRCLQRDAKLRWRDIGDVRLEIECLGAPDETRGVTGRGTITRTVPIATGVVGLLLGIIGSTSLAPNRETGTAVQTCFEVIGDVSTLRIGEQFAVSPDGQTVAYINMRGHVVVRKLDEFRGRVLHESRDARSVFFSPDGKWLAFWSEGAIRKIPIDGGATVSIARTGPVRGADWGANGEIAFTETVTGIKVVPENGGEVESITRIDVTRVSEWYTKPRFNSNGTKIFFASPRGIEVVDRPSGQVSTVIGGARVPAYTSSDDLLFMRPDGTVWAVKLDASTLEKRGVATLVWREPVRDFVVANNGTLVFLPAARDSQDRRLVWVDRGGAVEPLKLDRRKYLSPRLSPDGRFAAVGIEVESQVEGEVWVVDLHRGVQRRLAAESGAGWPVWTRDGANLVHTTFGVKSAGNLLERPADGSGKPTKIEVSQRLPIPISWSERSQTLAYYEYAQQADIWTMALDGGPEPFLVTKFDERSPVFSPDGKWIAFVTDESGTDQIEVASFPGGTSRIVVSKSGGTEPCWSHDGMSLSYRSGTRMMSVEFDSSSENPVGKPVVLFDDPTLALSPVGRGNPNYDRASDGRFLMVQFPNLDRMPRLHVVLNWDRD